MIRTIKKIAVLGLLTLATALPSAGSVLRDTTSINAKKLSERETMCLARNIYYESRGEPELGKAAVGLVTLNRAADEDFPSSVCQVVHQKSKVNNKTVCQFSWACNKPKAPAKTDPTWQESLQVANKLAQGGYKDLHRKYSNIQYFHSVKTNPRWKLKRVAKIGQHVFYR